jgi:hypothetical protein
VLKWSTDDHAQKLLELQNLPLGSDPRSRQISDRLYKLSGRCEGMSGRTLRRLPVLAAAKYLSGATFEHPAPVELFLEAMEMVAQAGAGEQST